MNCERYSRNLPRSWQPTVPAVEILRLRAESDDGLLPGLGGAGDGRRGALRGLLRAPDRRQEVRKDASPRDGHRAARPRASKSGSCLLTFPSEIVLSYFAHFF